MGKIGRSPLESMAKIQSPIEVEIKVNFRITLWDAIKLRIVGRGAEKILETAATQAREGNNETKKDWGK